MENTFVHIKVVFEDGRVSQSVLPDLSIYVQTSSYVAEDTIGNFLDHSAFRTDDLACWWGDMKAVFESEDPSSSIQLEVSSYVRKKSEEKEPYQAFLNFPLLSGYEHLPVLKQPVKFFREAADCKETLSAKCKEALPNDGAVKRQLIQSSINGDLSGVRKALALGADVHALEDAALWEASQYGHTDVVKLLLEAGADVHAQEDRALREASQYGHTDVVKLLLEAGADVHALEDRALQEASWEGRTEVVKLLLEAGADVHAQEDRALREASMWGKTEVVKLLLEAGADVHANDEQALRLAYRSGKPLMAKLLLSFGANAAVILTGDDYKGFCLLNDFVKERKRKVGVGKSDADWPF